MDDGVAVDGKIKAGDAVVAVKYDCIALCGIGIAEIEHAHIHTDPADYLAHAAENSVGGVDRHTVSRGVTEYAVGITDSDRCGIDFFFDSVLAAVSEFVAFIQPADARDLGAELKGGLQPKINAGCRSESE